MSIFSERLIDLMKNNKLTKQALANYLGISRPAVSQFTNAVNMPNLNTLLDIANYFDVSIDYLLGRDKFLADQEKKIIEKWLLRH